jgi:hypothetical protein
MMLNYQSHLHQNKNFSGTHHCVKCVDKHIPERKGYMIYGHKTAGEIVIAEGSENIRRLEREYFRSR